MKNSIKPIFVVLTISLISCGSATYSPEDSKAEQIESKAEYYEETSEVQMSATEDFTNSKTAKDYAENQQAAISSVATSMVNDSTMRFIRKANLTYKTESVRNTTYYIENAVVGMGGIVTYTNLYSEIESVKKIAISNDSSLKVTTYEMHNAMTIRIPNTQLDSLLKVISKSVSFLDERTITASEISLTQLKNQLEQKRLAQYQNQLKEAINGNDGKINKVVDAYENMLYKQKLEDEATIRNLELDYEVAFSSVQLSIYQSTSVDKILVENELNIAEYQPSFFSQFKDSLVNGWNAILLVIVKLANLWFFFLLIIPAVIIYKRRK